MSAPTCGHCHKVGHSENACWAKFPHLKKSDTKTKGRGAEPKKGGNNRSQVERGTQKAKPLADSASEPKDKVVPLWMQQLICQVWTLLDYRALSTATTFSKVSERYVTASTLIEGSMFTVAPIRTGSTCFTYPYFTSWKLKKPVATTTLVGFFTDPEAAGMQFAVPTHKFWTDVDAYEWPIALAGWRKPIAEDGDDVAVVALIVAWTTMNDTPTLTGRGVELVNRVGAGGKKEYVLTANAAGAASAVYWSDYNASVPIPPKESGKPVLHKYEQPVWSDGVHTADIHYGAFPDTNGWAAFNQSTAGSALIACFKPVISGNIYTFARAEADAAQTTESLQIMVFNPFRRAAQPIVNYRITMLRVGGCPKRVTSILLDACRKACYDNDRTSIGYLASVCAQMSTHWLQEGQTRSVSHRPFVDGRLGSTATAALISWLAYGSKVLGASSGRTGSFFDE